MPKGVIVMQVEEGSPAMENGIQATDVITSLDGSEVESMQDYMAILRDRKPGDTISVSLWRKGKSEQIGSHQHTDGIRTRVQFPATAFLRYNFHGHKNIDHNT